jgi:hypothetical protein
VCPAKVEMRMICRTCDCRNDDGGKNSGALTEVDRYSLIWNASCMKGTLEA